MLKRPNHTTQLLKSKPRGYLYNNEMILLGRVMSQIKPLKILIINPAHKMTRTLKHTYTLFVWYAFLWMIKTSRWEDIDANHLLSVEFFLSFFVCPLSFGHGTGCRPQEQYAKELANTRLPKRQWSKLLDTWMGKAWDMLRVCSWPTWVLPSSPQFAKAG